MAAFTLFLHGEFTIIKLLVAPESIIALDDDGGDRVRGNGVDSKISVAFILFLLTLPAPIFQASLLLLHPRVHPPI